MFNVRTAFARERLDVASVCEFALLWLTDLDLYIYFEPTFCVNGVEFVLISVVKIAMAVCRTFILFFIS